MPSRFSIGERDYGWWTPSTLALNDGVEHLVEFIRNTGMTSYFVDGNALGSRVATSYSRYATPNWIVGGVGHTGSASNGVLFNGTIRDVRVERGTTTTTTTTTWLLTGKPTTGYPQLSLNFQTMLFYGMPEVQIRRFYRQLQKMTRIPAWWGLFDIGPLPLSEINGRVFQRDEEDEVNVPLANARVVLFTRRTYMPVDMQYSDEDGYVQFKNLMAGTQEYFAVAFDPDGAPMQNAIIWDRLSSTPM